MAPTSLYSLRGLRREDPEIPLPRLPKFASSKGTATQVCVVMARLNKRHVISADHVSRWSNADSCSPNAAPETLPCPPPRERHWRRLIHPRPQMAPSLGSPSVLQTIPGARCPATFSGSCSPQASGPRACSPRFPQSDQLSLHLSPLRSLHCPALSVLECGRAFRFGHLKLHCDSKGYVL